MKRKKYSNYNNTIIISRLITIISLCVGLFLCADITKADDKIGNEHKTISQYDIPGLKKKISLDIRDMEIVNFLKFIAMEGDLNIVASNKVKGPVNLLIDDVTIGDALEIVLSINNLAYEVKNNIIKVITNDEYNALYGEDFYDQRQTYIYQLKYASAANVGALLGNAKSEIGKVIFNESTGTVVIIDTPEKIKEMKKIIEKEELPTVTRVLPTKTKVFELKYAKVDDIKDQIKQVLTPDIGTMQTHPGTNTIIVTDLPQTMEKIQTIINAFDRKKREVFIEAKIVEVTLSDTFKWGIDWSRISNFAMNNHGNTRRYSITTEANLPLNLTDNYGKLSISSLSSGNLSAVLEVLQTVAETRILSNPHITVNEGEEATIKVIEKQPYQEETTTTASGGTSTTSKTYQWVEVGVSFSVTPQINEDGYISMLIKPEVSSISAWYGGSAQSSGSVPVVKSADAETTVTVKDGVTIIIAGLIKDQKTKSVNKVPLLGDIPVLGKAFQAVSDDIRRTETVVFLTPKIVNGDKSFTLKRDMQKKMLDIRK